MLNLMNADIFTLETDESGKIIDSSNTIFELFGKSELQAFKKYFNSLTSSISLLKTKISINSKKFLVCIESYKDKNKIILKFYKLVFYFEDENDLLKFENSKEQYTFIYNISKKKIEYLKGGPNFLIINNQANFNISILDNIKVNPEEMKKGLKMYDMAMKNPSKEFSDLICVNLLKEEQKCYLTLKYNKVKGNEYLYVKILKLNIKSILSSVNSHDSLTRLLTYQSAEKIYTENKELYKDSYFVLIDIDFFTNINELYGYNFGSKLLVEFAKKIKVVFEDSAIIYRSSGDEFGVVVNTTLNKLNQCLSLLKGENSLNVDGVSVNVMCTIGVYNNTNYCKFSEGYDNSAKAMLAGKIKGRDKVEYYNSSKHAALNLTKDGGKKLSYKSKKNTIILFNELVEILVNTRRISEVVNDVLRKILDFFEHDRIIFVMETKEACHEYYVDKVSDFKSSISEIEGLNIKYDDNNVSIVNDIHSIENNNRALFEYLSANNVSSQIAISLKTKGIKKGYFIIQKQNNKAYIPEDITNISIISKVLSSFVVKEMSEQFMEHEAYIDSVTGHWNLNMIKDIVSRNAINNYAIIYFDISNFNIINDRFGYIEGDKLLRALMDFLKTNFTKNELYCRLVDDKFVMLLYDYDEAKINARYSYINSFVKEHTMKQYGYSLGIKAGAYIKQDEDDFTISIDKANRARHKAEKQILFYSSELIEEDKRKKELEEALEIAIINSDFEVYLQPCINLKNKKMISAEALVRWNRNGTIVYPDVFIPILEKNHKIVELDFCIYEKVCQYICDLRSKNIKIFPISMNISRCHVLYNDFVPRLIGLLNKYKLPSSIFALEITESAFVCSNKELKKFVQSLRKYEFNIYIDDFGIAYSNISLLGQISADVLKLDKGFLDHEITNKEYIILENIVRMARDLGMKVLCEGIEGKKELKIAKSLKCDYVQGYYFDKPICIEEFNKKYVYKNKKIGK